MKNLKGLKTINGHKVLTLHNSISRKDKDGFGIHVDYINKSITFVGDAVTPDMLRVVADVLEAESIPIADDAPEKAGPKKRVAKKKGA